MAVHQVAYHGLLCTLFAMSLAMPLEKMAKGDEGAKAQALSQYFIERGCIPTPQPSAFGVYATEKFAAQTYSEMKTSSVPAFMAEHPGVPAYKIGMYLAIWWTDASTFGEDTLFEHANIHYVQDEIDWTAAPSPFSDEMLCPVAFAPDEQNDVHPGSPLTVHGDPMFQHDGKGEHFWLKEGVLSPLLDWTSDDGHKMSLQGLTVANAETGHQWFKRIALVRDGKQVFDAKAGFGTKPVLAMSGDAILPLASRNTTAVLDVSTKFVGPKTLQKAVQVIKAGGMTFELTAESAHKFADAVQQQKYAHINVKMPNGLAKDATGLFAELAGAQPMSDATKALLASPN